ncbi:MAG: alpha/beta hydrolase [Candidatus Spechtbacterales bacterium]|nr:alpha/beta hydrolase [Candidatus Spechtbacterales bacterium]
MKTAIILHGSPSKEEYYNPEFASPSNMHWLPWLQRQLLLEDILAQAPELPKPYMPSYEGWRSVFERFDVNKDTHLIGHSAGAGFLVRWLSENKVEVGNVALVAPWLDTEGEYNDFLDFSIDGGIVRRSSNIKIFYSTDDDKDVLDSVTTLKDELKEVEFEKFTDKGHFVLSSMGTEEFPELRDFII